MPQVYTEADLAHLIKGLEDEFTKEFEKNGVLSKSEDGEKKEEKPSDEEKDGEQAPPPAESEPETEEAAPAAPHAEEDLAAAPAPAPAEEGHGYDAEDIEHMKQMYASMSEAELMAHHDAVKEALDAKAAAPAAGAPAIEKCGPTMGKSEKPHDNAKALTGDKENGAIEGSNPHGPVGARSEASKDSKNLKDLEKAEHQRRNGGQIDATGEPKGSPGAKSPASKEQGNLDNMEKSEDLKKSIEAKDAEIAELKKNMGAVQEFLTKFVGKITPAPKGKAITEIGTLAKNEDGGSNAGEMSKSEITARLLQKSQDPQTSVQDRAAINAYYLNGANVNTISHLLK